MKLIDIKDLKENVILIGELDTLANRLIKYNLDEVKLDVDDIIGICDESLEKYSALNKIYEKYKVDEIILSSNLKVVDYISFCKNFLEHAYDDLK